MIEAFYQVCSSLNDQLLLAQYQKDIEKAYEESEKRARILENRLNYIAIEKNLLKEKNEPYRTEEIVIQDYDSYFEMLDQEDADELEDLLLEMESYVTVMFNDNTIDEMYLEKFADVIFRYSSVINLYPIFMELSSNMKILSANIKQNLEILKENKNEFAEYFESFQYTLENFKIKVWGHQIDDPTFFNNSIISDIDLINRVIENVTAEDDIEFF